MRVRMLTTVAGTREDGSSFVYPAGEEVEVPTGEAKDLCARPEGMPRAEPIAVRPVDQAERR